MRFDRRQLMKALGFGALGAVAAPGSLAFAGEDGFPARIVFFVQPHGHVPSAWKLRLPGLPADRFAELPLAGLSAAELPAAWRPLHPFRERLLTIEGLAHTSVLMDISEITREGMGDLNNHQVAVTGLLTGTRAAQHPGQRCTGGSTSIDQVLAQRTGAPGRFGSRVYGGDYVPNQTVSPFSFLAANQSTPVVKDPAAAFADLLGLYVPPAQPGPMSRAELLRAKRASVLDAVAEEYRVLAGRLGAAGRQKLEAHRALVRDLELGAGLPPMPAGVCQLERDPSGHVDSQFMRLIKLAFACDLTRVATFVAPVPQCAEFGYPADAVVHATYAHASVPGMTSCGQIYSPVAEQAMTDLGAWYAGHLATLLKELDSVPEGAGTMLDHTVVVWLTELGTPTHQHHDAFHLLAGGCHDFFKLGRYVRYPSTAVSPLDGAVHIGPGHNRLLVSLLQAMGQADTSFGMTDAVGADGSAISLRGPLVELHA